MLAVTLFSAALLAATATAAAGGLDLRQARRRSEELMAKRKVGTSYRFAEREATGPRFLNEKTKEFAVNGTGIPEVDFDVGESYAGSLPISSVPDEQSNLFFWFFPSTSPAAEKEILIWLNGGPGCSSFEGLIQENGPFVWQYGTYKPVTNPWSWHTLTNVVWIEQPVGTGFATGNVTARNEQDVAEQFMGFWKNFVDVFAMQGYKVYITGESYAGMYCPYIANAMLDAEDKTYFDVSGVMMYDPAIAQIDLLQSIPVVQFVDYWGGLFPFNETFRASLHARDEKCGYSAFLSEHLVYPPKGHLPSLLPSNFDNGTTVPDCLKIFYDVLEAALLVNPCFDIYQVATTCPLLWDVLGFPGSMPYVPEGASVYFDRPDVKAAIHAPPSVSWAICAEQPVFVDNIDASPESSLTVLPRVIDATQNVIIGHGALDMVLIANGTLLAIQNMTWGGQLGFQQAPSEPFYVPYSNLSESASTLAAAGVFGTVHTERGLTYVGIALAGHMVPQYAPSAAYRQLEFLLGRVNCMNCSVPFTTDTAPPPQSEQPMGNGTAP